MHTRHVHRCPNRAASEPITDAGSAARILAAVIRRPLRDETVALLLDGERRGVAIVVVAGTVDDDAVLEVVELVTAPSAHDGRVAAAVIASVRPGRSSGASADVERWMELSDIVESHGAELVEWFVIDVEGVSCPRDQLGEPPRW